MYKLKFNSKGRQYSLALENKEEVIHILDTTHLVTKVNLWDKGKLLSQQEVVNLVNRISKQPV
jgi:hypothetical protein